MRRFLARLVPSTGTVVGLLLTAVVWQFFMLNPVVLQRLDLLASALRFRARGIKAPSGEVVIAAIDEKSIDQLGRWPWPYTMQAQLVDRLVEYGAAAIGYDVVFSSSDTSAGVENLRTIQDKLRADSGVSDGEAMAFLERAVAEADHDRIFAEAMQRSGRTVLGYFFHWNRDDVVHLREVELERYLQNIRGSKYDAIIKAGGTQIQHLALPSAWAVESSIAPLSMAAWGGGFFNSSPDFDGVNRRYRLIVKYRNFVDVAGEQDYLFAPLGVRVLERYLQTQDRKASTTFWIGPDGVTRVGIQSGKGTYVIPTDWKGQMLINHLGPSTPRPLFPRYSIADILAGRHEAAPPEAFRDKMVLVGATALGLVDLRVTPFDPNFPGVELHATVIDNMLRGDFLVEPWWADVYTGGMIFVLGILLTFALPRLGAAWSGLSAVLVLLASLAVNYGLFIAEGLRLNLVYPLLVAVVVAGGMTLYRYVIEEKDKRFIRKTFETYLSPALIERMVQNKTMPKLGGESGVHSAYFTDIASFSSFSEALSATKLVELLNEYLTAMTDMLLKEGGTLDKYEGDAILAFFGAPVPLPDHAARALRTALGMQRALADLREKWTAEGDKWPDLIKQMRMRIGICSGDFVTGNMGSTMRMDYTMMGDVVNTAARLEASAKQYGIYIQCTFETLQMAGMDAFEWRTIDKVRVVGRTEPLDAVEIMAFKGQLPETQMLMRDMYHQGIDLYRQQKWEEAKAKFTESVALEEVFPRRPTTPSQVYLERCDFFKDHPPGADWDGVWTLTSK